MTHIAWKQVSSDLILFQILYCIVIVQSFSHVWLSETPWTAACQTSLSITNSWSLVKFMSIELVMPSNYVILCCPPFCIIFYNFLKTQSFIFLRCPFTEQSPFASSTDLGWLPSRVTQILTPESLNLWLFCLARLHAEQLSVYYCLSTKVLLIPQVQGVV